MRSAGILTAGGLAVLAGCHGLGNLLEEALKERPPAALDVMSVASDARVDSVGVLAGSFVGEGTPRGVHLLSSDTVFIAGLARRGLGVAILSESMAGAFPDLIAVPIGGIGVPALLALVWQERNSPALAAFLRHCRETFF